MTLQHRMLKTHPAVLVLASFLLLILVGASLLKLPIASTGAQLSWIDALFTTASAVCVTGLTVVDTATTFTLFGQCVILGMIQAGGLGVMTVSVALFSWLGHAVSLRQRQVVQNLFAHTPRQDIYSLVRSVISFTLATELAGALLLIGVWADEMPLGQACYFGVFHAVSAFCNAGFALFSDNLASYSANATVNMTVCTLIVVGGIGFPVLYDLQSWLLTRTKHPVRLSVQTKTVLWTTALLIGVGALMFAVLERGSAMMADKSGFEIFLVSLFQSITCRTAGFNTVDIGALREVTIVMMIFLMFIGASPGSCGGGVKTTTLALLTCIMISRIRHRKRVNMFRKSIPEQTVQRTTSLITLSTFMIGLVVFMLLLSDSFINIGAGHTRINTLQYLFETVSAFATVGLTMGITPSLTTWDKSWIILMMIIGRVGVLTFSYIIVGPSSLRGREYSEENMMIG